MYSVVKRDGRIIDFDLGKISEAIQKAFAAVEPVLEEIDAMVEEAVDNFGRVMYSLAHSLAHWVLHAYYSFRSRIRQAITFDPRSAVRLATVVLIRVKLLTVTFLEHAHVYRAARLLRTQDRGTGENSDSDNIKNIILRNRIVFGAPGTGKSHLLKEDADDMLYNTDGTFERVTFHPEYTYSQFVGSYKPVTNAEGEIRYDFVPGPFMRVLVAALKSGRTDSPQPHLLLIEEINRAKVAAVFGDVFQLLDRNDDGSSEYEIHTTEDIRKYLISALGRAPESIKIPDNMFVWATMNSADQGVFPMDTAFKRRWSFEYIGIDDNDSEVGGKVELGTGEYRRIINWNQLRRAINDTLSEEYGINEDKLLGPYFLSRRIFEYNNDGWMLDGERFKNAFKSKVIMYLFEDAAKSVRQKLFDGCPNTRYSAICNAFDEIGIDIFGSDFVERYDSLEE